MLHRNRQIIRGVTYSDFINKCICAALLIFSVSCSSDFSIQNETLLTEESEYSLVFIIHGDGNYFYHDTNGNEYKADEVTLEKAKKIAQQNLNAEVFIFHQKPERNFLLFFPLKDGEFYYYRNGQLLANETYWRDQEVSNFDFEAGIYNSFSASNQHEMLKMFLYFGHEIPELGGVGYDESYPDRAFNIKHLASGLNSLTSDSTKFDLMILSTCFGGTPYTIRTLTPYAKYIIASPENLHLSYFDLDLLERLDFNLHDRDIHAFAKRFA
ncbi:MAG: clostripain-related cysteine peptidase [Melioribacteraceae bacterium]|nr:clostripain-related cysteine peptidase [Melioribacteraceae bacterium]